MASHLQRMCVNFGCEQPDCFAARNSDPDQEDSKERCCYYAREGFWFWQ
jgi:hypothetical protein